MTNRPLALVCTILAFGCGWVNAAITVGYYTDNNAGSTGPAASITASGYSAVQIANIATFNLSTIQILLINESSNAPSAALLGQGTAISNWVAGGGIVAIHDRNVCLGTCTPVPGGAGISFLHSPGPDINVENAGTLVTNGPFGVINNTNLDNGNFSDQGFATLASLPSGSTGILNNGTVGNEVALVYRLGSGWVYYSTIPLDFFLSGATPAAFSSIYAPNMVAFLGSLVNGVPVTPQPTANATAAPSLSQWGMGILAILLIAFAALALRSRPNAGTSS
jgi:hypothetical protein